MSAHLPIAAHRATNATLRRLIFSADIPFDKQRRRLNTALAMTSRSELRCDIANVPCVTHVVEGSPATVVYVHGGGFCVGTPAMGAALLEALRARWGVSTIAVDYALAPECPFPAALNQVREVVKSIDGSVILIGDSAGANLALATALDDPPSALVLLSPWLDLSADRRVSSASDPLLSASWLDACATAYTDVALDSPMVSPLYGDLATLGPTLVIGGSDDVLAPDAEALARRSDRVEVKIFEGMWHDFALSVGRLAAADEALEVLGGFLEKVTGLSSP